MKITCEAQRLSRACQIANKVVGNKARSLLALGYLTIEAKDGRATARATNLENTAIIDLFASVQEEGKVQIPIRRSGTFARYEKGVVEISDNANNKKVMKRLTDQSDDKFQLLVKVKGVGTELALAEPYIKEELPVPEYSNFDIALGDILPKLRLAYAYTAAEQSRPVLCAILMDFTDGKLSLAAADGFRLISIDLPLLAGPPLAKELLLHRDTSQLMYSFMTGNISMGFNSEDNISRAWFKDNISRAWFKDEAGLILISQLVQGNYPKYRSLVPSDLPKFTAKVSGPLLVSCLQQFYSDSGIARLTADVKEQRLYVDMQVECEGKFNASLPAEVTTVNSTGEEPDHIAFNQNYIIELARHFAEVTMEATEKSQPGKFYGELPGVTVTVMPMFIKW